MKVQSERKLNFKRQEIEIEKESTGREREREILLFSTLRSRLVTRYWVRRGNCIRWRLGLLWGRRLKNKIPWQQQCEMTPGLVKDLKDTTTEDLRSSVPIEKSQCETYCNFLCH